MTYKEYKELELGFFKAFPLKFSFSERQTKEVLDELNAGKDDVSFCDNGLVVRKCDYQYYTMSLKLLETIENDLIKDDTFVIDMFLFEMNEMEFVIYQNVEALFRVCDINTDALTPRMWKLLDVAKTRYLKDVRECNG